MSDQSSTAIQRTVVNGCDDHTYGPSDYVGWHAWAEEKAKTHTQTKCPECGLFLIWEPADSGSRSVDYGPCIHGPGDPSRCGHPDCGGATGNGSYKQPNKNQDGQE